MFYKFTFKNRHRLQNDIGDYVYIQAKDVDEAKEKAKALGINDYCKHRKECYCNNKKRYREYNVSTSPKGIYPVHQDIEKIEKSYFTNVKGYPD